MDPIDIVYVFGAGSVKGAWEPVLRALAKKSGGPIERDIADWWFGVQTAFVHLIASWGKLPDAQLEVRFGEGDHPENRKRMQELDGKNRAKMRDLKEAIATELHAAHANGEIKVREELLEMVAADAGNGRTAILTANWDLALDKWLEQSREPVKLVHLHGSIAKPTGMLLPGERPEELYREPEDNAAIANSYVRAMYIFGFARRVYIAGLSLSPLDAPLGVALGMGLGDAAQHVEEVVIVNLERENDRIARQLRDVLPDGCKVRQMPVRCPR